MGNYYTSFNGLNAKLNKIGIELFEDIFFNYIKGKIKQPGTYDADNELFTGVTIKLFNTVLDEIRYGYVRSRAGNNIDMEDLETLEKLNNL